MSKQSRGANLIPSNTDEYQKKERCEKSDCLDSNCMKVRANLSWVNIKGGVSWGAGVYVGITENHVELMFPE